jgi:hypothetical protein
MLSPGPSISSAAGCQRLPIQRVFAAVGLDVFAKRFCGCMLSTTRFQKSLSENEYALRQSSLLLFFDLKNGVHCEQQLPRKPKLFFATTQLVHEAYQRIVVNLSLMRHITCQVKEINSMESGVYPMTRAAVRTRYSCGSSGSADARANQAAQTLRCNDGRRHRLRRAFNCCHPAESNHRPDRVSGFRRHVGPRNRRSDLDCRLAH